MSTRVDAFIKAHGGNPDDIYAGKSTTGIPPIVYLNPGSAGEFVVWSKWVDMRNRYWIYYQTHNNTAPAIIWINQVSPNPIPQTGQIQTALEKVVGSFNTFTEFYNRINAHYKYGYYFDDQLNLQQEESGAQPENCVDLAELLHALGHEMGYTVRFVGIYCVTDQINHAYIEIQGKEFGNSWVAGDGAAAASDNYSLGTHWCNGSITYNPTWIPSEDL